jgi:hypothetical protein
MRKLFLAKRFSILENVSVMIQDRCHIKMNGKTGWEENAMCS